MKPLASPPSTSPSDKPSADGIQKCIVIAVCTKQRPEMLKRCLESLVQQESKANWIVKIIVIENDEQQTSRSTVETLAHHSKYKVFYFQETDPGIPQARNRAIVEALKLKCNYLGFIDDDETAGADWINGLVNAIEHYDAEVIQGRVIYEYPPDDIWRPYREDKYSNKRYEGKALHSAATNNVAISALLFAGTNDTEGLRFDKNMRFTGGSDTDFFNRVRLNGGRIIYTENAIVRETVPIERCSLKWLFNRELRITASGVYIDSKNIGRKRAYAKHLKRATTEIVHCVVYALGSVTIYIFNKNKAVQLFLKSYLKLANSCGRFTGLSGRILTPYKSIEGT